MEPSPQISWEERGIILFAEINSKREDFQDVLWHPGGLSRDFAARRAEKTDGRDPTIHSFAAFTGNGESPAPETGQTLVERANALVSFVTISLEFRAPAASFRRAGGFPADRITRF